MLRRTFALASIAFALSMFAATEPLAVVLPQRTFVASFGNDGNPCSLTLPCRGFAAAVAQTISGGEVIVLDSAGYGPVTIAQSVSIIAPAGVYAGISVPASGTGVAIIGAGINVVLRGLTINSTGGSYGIRMTNGSELTVENCVVSNFNNFGLSIETAATVNIAETAIRDNLYGIVAGFGATANITNSQVIKSGFEGIEIFGGPPSTTTSIFIADTLVTGSGAGGSSYGIDNYAVAGATGNISATRVMVTGCTYAIYNEPSGAGTTTVSNSMISGNAYAFLQQTGTFNSLGNNHLSENTNPNVGTITLIGGQ